MKINKKEAGIVPFFLKKSLVIGTGLSDVGTKSYLSFMRNYNWNISSCEA